MHATSRTFTEPVAPTCPPPPSPRAAPRRLATRAWLLADLAAVAGCVALVVLR
ncbi:hypothetical protein [Baekduia soli]|uniref:hypothetical protein n=1 Tax=Baekduia soli TaxID=496014 RepID=UPI001652463F|nr:hypothetical protein [Baekduia soli]